MIPYSCSCFTEAEKLMREFNELQEQRLCKVCLDEEINMVFLPCGHLVCCSVCAPALSKCPICRTAITDTVRTYLSWMKIIYIYGYINIYMYILCLGMSACMPVRTACHPSWRVWGDCGLQRVHRSVQDWALASKISFLQYGKLNTQMFSSRYRRIDLFVLNVIFLQLLCLGSNRGNIVILSKFPQS